VTELEPPVVAIFREGRKPPDQSDGARVAGWQADVAKMLKEILEPHLATQSHLLPGEDFTLADLSLAALVGNVKAFNLLPAECVRTERWLQRCLSRPAWQKIQEPA
jgi:glutathione S-transferase